MAAVATKRKAVDYPRCGEAFIPVARHSTGFLYVPRRMLGLALEARGKAFATHFNNLFGVQTCAAEGPYAWDVEAVLERMATGRHTGTQTMWD